MPRDRTTSVALLLIVAVTLVFMYFQSQKAKRQKQEQQQSQGSEQPAAPGPAQGAEKPPEPEGPTPLPEPTDEQPSELFPDTLLPDKTEEGPAPRPAQQPPPEHSAEEAALKARTYSVSPENARFDLIFSSYGAALESARLLDFWASHEHKERFKLIDAYTGPSRQWTSLALATGPDHPGPDLGEVNYEIGERGDNFITFHHTFPDGLTVTKSFEISVEEHARHLLVTVTFEKTAGHADEYQYEILGAARVRAEYFDRKYLEAMIAASEVHTGKTDVSKKDPGDLAKKEYQQENNPDLPIMWVASTNKYFAAILKPLTPGRGTMAPWLARGRLRALEGTDVLLANNASNGRQAHEEAEVRKRFDNTVASLVTRKFNVTPGQPVTHRYLFYMGPKDRKAFHKVPLYQECDFAKVVDYGWFDFLSTVLLKILGFFHMIIPNYGVAIILLTLVVRAGLHPLTRKSQLSMRRMQMLQPEIKKLQQKYKGDRQRLGKEQMELFRKHGVNPMGGCLPLLIQLPVIVGLFRAIQLSVDLREAPFILWIHDLSRPDTIAHLAGIPVNILPIAMLISMIVQQKLQPKPPDPQQRRQQRMMMIVMVVMFGWIFYSFASGVVLYWLTSTFVGILEQRLINRHWEHTQAQKAPQAKGRNPDRQREPTA